MLRPAILGWGFGRLWPESTAAAGGCGVGNDWMLRREQRTAHLERLVQHWPAFFGFAILTKERADAEEGFCNSRMLRRQLRTSDAECFAVALFSIKRLPACRQSLREVIETNRHFAVLRTEEVPSNG